MHGVSTQRAQQYQDCYSWSTTGLMCARRPRGSLSVGAHERYEDGQIDPEPRRYLDGRPVYNSRSNAFQTRGSGAFYRASTVSQRCTALVPSAHSSVKIATLGTPPGSCALDVHEETSVSARMNVTRMGRSTQSLDGYLDGRPVFDSGSDAFQPNGPGGVARFTRPIEPQPYCSDLRPWYPVRTAAPRLLLLEHHRAHACSTSARKPRCRRA